MALARKPARLGAALVERQFPQARLLFLAIVAPPAVTLVWLGVQLLRQDRGLLARLELEIRQTASQMIVRSLEQLLSDAGRRMAEDVNTVPLGKPDFSSCESVFSTVRPLMVKVNQDPSRPSAPPRLHAGTQA